MESFLLFWIILLRIFLYSLGRDMEFIFFMWCEVGVQTHSQSENLNQCNNKISFCSQEFGKKLENLTLIPGGHKGKILVSKVTEGSINFYSPFRSKMAMSLKIKSTHAIQPSNSTSGNTTLSIKNINTLGHIYQDVYSNIAWGGKNKCQWQKRVEKSIY